MWRRVEVYRGGGTVLKTNHHQLSEFFFGNVFIRPGKQITKAVLSESIIFQQLW